MNSVTKLVIPLIFVMSFLAETTYGQSDQTPCRSMAAASRANPNLPVRPSEYKCPNRTYECAYDSLYCSCIRDKDFLSDRNDNPCRCWYTGTAGDSIDPRPLPPGSSSPLTPKMLRSIEGKRSKYSSKGTLEYVKRDTLPTVTFSPRYEPKDVGDDATDPKRDQSVPQIIRASGFICDEHKVTTKDGYILTLFRVRKGCLLYSAKPVYFQHGFLGSSADWLMIDKDRAIPFKAARLGLDVWLGNSRGTNYSRGHETLSYRDKRYWDFSFHEMGIYDLPAVFDYILKATQGPPEDSKKRKLSYVGHSMGTTMFYVCMSMNSTYNDNISSAVHLSSAAYLYHMTSPARLLLPLVEQYRAFPLNGPLLPTTISSLLHVASPELCRTKATFNGKSICENFVFFIAGGNQFDSNTTVLKTVLGHFPQLTATKVLIHFLQNVGFDGFRQFDYGPAKNFRRYGQWVPPKYNLFKVDTASLNIYGEQDILIDRVDAERTTREQGTDNVKKEFLIYDYNHIDFIWGDSAAFSVAQEVVDHLLFYVRL